jgi:hypothetical protein
MLPCIHFIGSSLDEGTAIVDGYNSYYGFPRSKSGYSGKVKVLFLTYFGVIPTLFCSNNILECNRHN